MDNDTSTLPFDRDQLEAMNSKAVQNQFFTPDHVYMDLSLFKDVELGVVYADTIPHGEQAFVALQTEVLKIIPDYQTRRYDCVDKYLAPLGYNNTKIKQLMNARPQHDLIFMAAPATMFLDLMIRHTIRNQNNSGPGNKFIKKKLDKSQYKLEALSVTFYINTYPLTLSDSLLQNLAKELGESFGVNIQFMNKDPMTFNQQDWDSWLNKIECFYLNSLGRFTRSEFIIKKQGDLQFAGCYFFARKRFETCVMADMVNVDFDQQIQITTALLDMMCDFTWLQNNDVRLTQEAQDVPMDDVLDITS